MNRTVTQIGRQPYEVLVQLRVCRCPGPPVALAVSSTPERAIGVAQAHWNLITTFFGDIPGIVRVQVIDARDGMIIWRNGRHETKVG